MSTGGRLTLLKELPEEAEQLIIRRTTPRTQEVDLNNGGRIMAELLELMANKTVLMIQELSDQSIEQDDYNNIRQELNSILSDMWIIISDLTPEGLEDLGMQFREIVNQFRYLQEAYNGLLLSLKGHLNQADMHTVYVTGTRTIVTTIEELQAVIDSLPKFLYQTVEIKVTPGEINSDIVVERFFGPGNLSIICCDDDLNPIAEPDVQTHKVVSIKSEYNINTEIKYTGFTMTGTGVCMYVYRSACRTDFNYCNAVEGSNAEESNYGLRVYNCTGAVRASQCTISNKLHAVDGFLASFIVCHLIKGINNGTIYYVTEGSWLAVTGATEMTGNTLFITGRGSFIVDNNHYLVGHARLDSPVFTGSPQITDSNNVNNRIAAVSNSSDANVTALPVGSIIAVNGVTNMNRNASATIRLGSTSTEYRTDGSGTALSGTWRSCGIIGTGTIFRRTV